MIHYFLELFDRLNWTGSHENVDVENTAHGTESKRWLWREIKLF